MRYMEFQINAEEWAVSESVVSYPRCGEDGVRGVVLSHLGRKERGEGGVPDFVPIERKNNRGSFDCGRWRDLRSG
jgi:hypothetical protein